MAQKIALDGDAEALARLRREHQVGAHLGALGGELISKCLGHNFTGRQPFIVVTRRGRPLADLVRDEANWPPDAPFAQKIITDLLQGLDILRREGIVHRGLSLHTLCWDGTTLQITDFGDAALSGEAPDGTPARHAEDIRAAALVIYRVHTGEAPPEDPGELRAQIENLHGPGLAELLLSKDPVTSDLKDYALADEPDLRPESWVLLGRYMRLTRDPKNSREARLAARDHAVRTEFGALRERQRQFRAVYDPWDAARPPRRRPRQRQVFRPQQQQGQSAPANGWQVTPDGPEPQPWVWPVLGVVILLFVVLLVGLLS